MRSKSLSVFYHVYFLIQPKNIISSTGKKTRIKKMFDPLFLKYFSKVVSLTHFEEVLRGSYPNVKNASSFSLKKTSNSADLKSNQFYSHLNTNNFDCLFFIPGNQLGMVEKTDHLCTIFKRL